MQHTELKKFIEEFLSAVGRRLPEYLQHPANAGISKGNFAVCVIDPDGNIHGRLFGSDKIMQRSFFRNAWTKASQVWITGIRTGEFERLVFTGQINERTYGLSKPDFIGWDGGQPLSVDPETVLSVGCSGLIGEHDLEIAVKAFEDTRK